MIKSTWSVLRLNWLEMFVSSKKNTPLVSFNSAYFNSSPPSGPCRLELRAEAPASLPRLKNPSGNQVIPRARLRPITTTIAKVMIMANPQAIKMYNMFGASELKPPSSVPPSEDAIKIRSYMLLKWLFFTKNVVFL